MTDEKDLEIARLRGQLEARGGQGGAAVGTLKVLAVLAAVAVAVVGCMAVLGSNLPEGFRYEQECRAAAGARYRDCMSDLEHSYRGPDEHRYRQNAADLWAAENLEGQS